MPNFMILKDFLPKLPKMKRQIRDYTKFDEGAFNNDVSRIWLLPTDFSDTNKLYDKFHNDFLKVINTHAPIKTLSIKETKKRKLKPWITKGIQVSIGKKY